MRASGDVLFLLLQTNESRRTRNQAQSPETAVVTKEDDIADRKTADSSSTDEKKAEKDKAEETSVAEEKRSVSHINLLLFLHLVNMCLA